ncbi:NAD(P)/FAD-dependent oxidoreductase [Nocardioides cheoyonin]|uniref:NAD(P)/FAD-dependent oxidoreductase n=1 Tax=Nocardioides cheoyonin TaxID=3156615 RepID=UPI0032B50E60
MATPASIVVIGAGLAAANAVETLREEGYAGSLTVVGSEPEPPYERPQLSKEYLLGDSEFGLVHEAEWYAERDVRLLTGVTATALDREARTVTLDSGETLPYDALLLATGATPRVPDLPGIDSAYFLRTVADARRLKAALTPGARVVLVGGGWIGLEVAAAARAHDAQAVVLEAAGLPLYNVLGPDIARYLVDLHIQHGVEIRTGVKVEAIEPDGVITGDGKVAADVVVVAIGAVPETTLAQGAGLVVSNGIEVDEHLRTSDPQIYAAGDVALATSTLLGPLRVEHWDNAIRQGQLAAKAMLAGPDGGKDDVYDWLPYFYTDQFEFSMEYVGRGSAADDVVVRGDQGGNEFIAYWLREGIVTAGMNVGIWDVNDKLREIVGTSPDPDELTDLR